MDPLILFSELGFHLLGEFEGPHVPVRVRCTAHGYEVECTLVELQVGTVCKYCTLRRERHQKRKAAPKPKRTVRNLERRRELAVENAHKRGFDIIGEFKDSRTPVLVRCAKGHESMKTPNDIQQGGGCRFCYAEKLMADTKLKR